MIQTAILGFGNIGSGVAKVIENNRRQIEAVLPEGMCVRTILDLRDFPDSPYRVVHTIDDILSDPDIRVVCETMGGVEPAFTFTKRALEKGISVVTSNKELVDAHGPELLALARANGCSYLFEASVGGGIPLIRTVEEALGQERLEQIVGILNGTTNYILTRMEREGARYEDALAEAQHLGYAERNPAADVEGRDTARKIAILSSLMTGKTVKYGDFPVEGIVDITREDMALAARANGTIRLLGVSRREGEAVSVITAPFVVSRDHPLAAVSDVFNGVLLRGNCVGDVMLYGRGAGSLPTGSAVVADMIQAARSPGKTIPVRWEGAPQPVAPASDMRFKRLIRAPREAVGAFADCIDKTLTASDGDAACTFTTLELSEADLERRRGMFAPPIRALRML